MNKLLMLLCTVLMIVACKSKKDTVLVEEKEAIEVGMERSEARKGKRGDRPRRPSVDPEQLVAQLNLSPEKEVEFLKFWEEMEEERKGIRSNAGEDRTAMRAAMQEFNAMRVEGLQGILTAEQMEKLNELVPNRRGGGGRRGGN